MADSAPLTIEIHTQRIPLADLLSFYLQGSHSELEGRVPHATLTAYCERFVRAGMLAMETIDQSPWIQLSFELRETERTPALFQDIAGTVSELRKSGGITNFFFMNKPPGMRLRFEVTRANKVALQHELERSFRRYVMCGRVGGVTHAVYEPESALFGGERSMGFVHELFTADSMLWLSVFSDFVGVAPTWQVSLCALRGLFDALGVRDWEDVDVWNRVRDNAGRKLQVSRTSLEGFDSMAELVRTVWSQPSNELPSQLASRVDAFTTAATRIASEWQCHYLAGPDARVGPRALAALLTIFHWNRALLSLERQTLIAEALAERRTV
jgi:thiopeptide-type bacteriocin biosynthesis protein